MLLCSEGGSEANEDEELCDVEGRTDVRREEIIITHNTAVRLKS